MCTLADEAPGDGDAAFLGNAEGDAGHHAAGLDQRVGEQRALGASSEVGEWVNNDYTL